MQLCNTSDTYFRFSSKVTGPGSIQGLGIYSSIIDDIQCSLQDCFVPDFLEVTQRCHDECLNHCILEAKENLVIYLILLLIIVFVLAGIVYYFETLIHRKRRRF
jgi:hypothetical protein|tara:strand:- start:2266 stop:2577 length:312 start_codon:yes stop_codon:yes gene_type:complete